jgi:hypothetical protein
MLIIVTVKKDFDILKLMANAIAIDSKQWQIK